MTAVAEAPQQVVERPPDVLDLLALLQRVAAPGGLRGATGDEALKAIEAAEAVKAWAESSAVAAAACLARELESERSLLSAKDLTRLGYVRFVRECRGVAAREIQVATGRPITQCQSLVWFAACEDERTATVRALMGEGRVSYARALSLVEKTQGMDAVAADRMAARVLAPLTSPSGEILPGQPPLSQATFNRRLNRQLVLHHGLVREAERTYAEALKRRDCRGEPHPSGTGHLMITGDGPRTAAAAERVDRIARRIRREGDRRTLAQLRSDVALDLLMRGWIPDDPTFRSLGKPPEALIRVIVPLSTLFDPAAGVSSRIGTGCGEIVGWGDITAAQCRALALQLGSVWERLVTDPLTGRAIEKTAGSYKVPKEMHDQVCVRDGTCRAPGCEIPADRSDLDHDIDWEPDDAGGPTAETNLAAKHRGHHNLKTRGWWSTEQDPDGVIQWTTATGRHYVTYPYVYDHFAAASADQSMLELRLGRSLGLWLNPAPLPTHGRSVLAGFGWEEALADTTPPPRAAGAPAGGSVRAPTGAPLIPPVAKTRPVIRNVRSDPGPPPF